MRCEAQHSSILWAPSAAQIRDLHAALGLKYSWFYGFPGRRLVVGYDNERANGDHRHLDRQELPYFFVSVEQLVADFVDDVRRIRGSL
jgi:Family of unknown function (DUF6516)